MPPHSSPAPPLRRTPLLLVLQLPAASPADRLLVLTVDCRPDKIRQLHGTERPLALATKCSCTPMVQARGETRWQESPVPWAIRMVRVHGRTHWQASPAHWATRMSPRPATRLKRKHLAPQPNHLHRPLCTQQVVSRRLVAQHRRMVGSTSRTRMKAATLRTAAAAAAVAAEAATVASVAATCASAS